MQLTIDSPSVRICTQPVDFRKSIDGLLEVVSSGLEGDPKTSIYVFYNRSRDRIKILAWHKNGFVLLLKRLEKGRFSVVQADKDVFFLTQEQLGWLIAGLDWISMSEWGELEFRDFR